MEAQTLPPFVLPSSWSPSWLRFLPLSLPLRLRRRGRGSEDGWRAKTLGKQRRAKRELKGFREYWWDSSHSESPPYLNLDLLLFVFIPFDYHCGCMFVHVWVNFFTFTWMPGLFDSSRMLAYSYTNFLISTWRWMFHLTDFKWIPALILFQTHYPSISIMGA